MFEWLFPVKENDKMSKQGQICILYIQNGPQDGVQVARKKKCSLREPTQIDFWPILEAHLSLEIV